MKKNLKWILTIVFVSAGIILAGYGAYKVYHYLVEYATKRITHGVAKGVGKGIGRAFKGKF